MSEQLGPEHRRLRDEILEQLRKQNNLVRQRLLDDLEAMRLVSTQEVHAFLDTIDYSDAFQRGLTETDDELRERILNNNHTMPDPIVGRPIQAIPLLGAVYTEDDEE